MVGRILKFVPLAISHPIKALIIRLDLKIYLDTKFKP